MSVVKYLIEIILATVIIFFVWNILKRIFFHIFYKNFPQFNPKNESSSRQSSKNKNLKEKVNWDAETIDYEEITENKRKKTD